MIANNAVMVTMVRPMAISGETIAIAPACSVRRSSTNCMRVLGPRAQAAAHQQSQRFAPRLGGIEWRREPAVEYHGDTVGDLDQLVEIMADHQHGAATACKIDQRLANGSGG